VQPEPDGRLFRPDRTRHGLSPPRRAHAHDPGGRVHAGLDVPPESQAVSLSLCGPQKIFFIFFNHYYYGFKSLRFMFE